MSEKRNCDIAQDLIPLEVDGVCTEGSKEFLQEHISQCEGCRRLYDLAKSGAWQKKKEPFKEDAALVHSMKKVGKKLHIRRFVLIFLSLIVLMYGSVFAWTGLMNYVTSVPLESYDAYVYAEEGGYAHVIAEMPYSMGNIYGGFERYKVLGADDPANKTGEAHAYIIELEPRYNPIPEKINARMGQAYQNTLHLPGAMEIRDGKLYTASDYMDGFVPGVPVSEIRLCEGSDYRVIYTWGDDVLTYEKAVEEDMLSATPSEAEYDYDGVIRELPKG